MGRKSVVLLFVISLLLFGHCVGYAAESQIKLKFAMFIPPVSKNAILFDQFCKDINKRTNGKVEVSYYPGGTLLPAPRMAAGVATGIADIGFSNCTYSRGRFPVMEAMELPLGVPSGWVGSHVANDFYEKVKPKEWEQYHPLIFGTTSGNIVQTRNKPVRTLEDFKGLKIRGMGRVADTVKALGATPMPIEMVDLYESLSKGVLDGNMGPPEVLKGFKIAELIKYLTATWKVGSTNAFYVIMNKGKWESLPPDVKKVFDETSKEYAEKWAVQMNEIDIEGREFFVSRGGQVLSISDAEAVKWTKAAEPVIGEFKKDLMAKGFTGSEVDSWISFIKERIEYWKEQEKARKIPAPYQY
jgi:TRAP-type transport system periplasmic protein